MPFTVTLPKLSPTMEEGVIAKWHKAVGDTIQPGEILIEVATDKATMEYQALDGGVLREILVPEGSEALVNQPIAICTEKAGESIQGYEPRWSGEGPPKATSPEFETQKESQEKTSSNTSIPSAKGASGMQQPAFRAAAPPSGWEAPKSSSLEGGRLRASPLAKKIAQEKGLSLEGIQGTGPDGRIVERDLAKASSASRIRFAVGTLPTTPPGGSHVEKLSPMRKAIGDRLQQSKTFIPHFYLSMDVDAAALVQCRAQLATWGVKVSINDFVVRATALTLKQHPEVNSGFDTTVPGIIRFESIDLSVAVAIPDGLITPIVRHADHLSLGQIATEVKSLAGRAREGKLQPEEYQGGSFTISNLGMYGVAEFQAILNPPQAAILGVSAVLDHPVIREGAVVPGKVMRLTLSVDHRVVDGALAAEFLKSLKQALEAPAGLLLI